MADQQLRDMGFVIRGAKSYLDLFTSQDTYGNQYRSYARILHPDSYIEDEDKALASELFQIFTEHADIASKAIIDGTWGALPALELRSRTHLHKYHSHSHVKADVADTFEGKTDDIVTFLKIAPNSSVNDLLAAEAKSLTLLNQDENIKDLRAFYPKLIDAFKVDNRAVNILEKLDGFYTVQQLREKFPYGMNVLDWIWMWRRILVALGGAHQVGVVHGAVLPEHVLIHPEKHGLVLVDWCYSKPVGQKLSAMSKRRSSFYPKEVPDKQPADQGTDIYMAVQTMSLLLRGTDVPRPIRAFLNGSSLQNQTRRPKDAFALLGEFDELLERMGEPFYPRRFRQLVVN